MKYLPKFLDPLWFFRNCTLGFIQFAFLALSMAATAMSAYSQVQQGKQAEKNAQYNAQVERNRAIQAQMDARAAAQKQRDKGEKLKKRQRALYAKAGVTGEGTPLEVMIDAATEMELEALDIERTGEVAARQHLDQGQMDIWEGQNKKSAGYIGAGSTLLSGAASSYGSYKNWKFQGGGV